MIENQLLGMFSALMCSHMDQWEATYSSSFINWSRISRSSEKRVWGSFDQGNAFKHEDAVDKDNTPIRWQSRGAQIS
jgi:hypothetical protein